MYYLITLDSHEYFGPFDTTRAAKRWARRTNRTSYSILPEPALPSYARGQLRAPR